MIPANGEHRPGGRPLWLGALIAALLLGACSSGTAGSARSNAGAGSGAATETATTATVAGGSGAATFTNPVFKENYPDPAVLEVKGMFYAYATQGHGDNIQTLTSRNLIDWTRGGDALPSLGPWAGTGNTWAPEVLAARGRYVLFYVAHDTTSGKQCIGRAQATSAGGPFTDRSKRPMVCQTKIGGSIDPNVVRTSDGKQFLYWKNDGNCCGEPVSLWGQQLSGDTGSLLGAPVRLLSNTRPWQGKLIEAPELVEHNHGYYLFYSANDYASDRYAIGYATCRSALGPCTDRSVNQPLVASTDAAAGPGHCFVLTLTDRSTWMFFHAWAPDSIGSDSPGRRLWLEPLTWTGDQPVVAPPSSAPLPAPLGPR